VSTVELSTLRDYYLWPGPVTTQRIWYAYRVASIPKANSGLSVQYRSVRRTHRIAVA